MSDNDKQQHSLYGIASLVVGIINLALVFRLFSEFFKAGGANFLFSALLMITGLILSIVGLARDSRKILAGLGLFLSSLQLCAIGYWLMILMVW